MGIELKSAGTPVIELMVLTTAVGDKIDISTQLVNLVLFEDIFSPVLNGEITVADNIGLFDHLPISGNETLTVKFYSYGYSTQNTPVNFIHRTFDILKVTDITLPTDYMKKYTLSFASPELKKNETIKISKSYPETTISNVIATLMTEDYDNEENEPRGLGFPDTPPKEFGPGFSHFRSSFLGEDSVEAQFENVDKDNSVEVFIEKTKYKEPFITIPYMKPFEIIKWLSTRAIRNALGRTNSNAANFMFFENKRGFQFVSLNTLLENKGPDLPIFAFGNAKQNLERPWEINRIENIRIENCYNILSNIKNGIYSSRLYTYELSTGLVKEKDYDYLEAFEQNETVDRGDGADFPTLKVDSDNKNPLTTKPLSKRMLLPIGHVRELDNITSGSTQRFSEAKPDVGSEEYLQARISQLSKLVDFRIMVEISANSEHKVGDLINLDLQMWGMDDNLNVAGIKIKPHKYYNGNYLITSIKHILTNFQYKMQIELAKDSLKAKIG